MAEIREESKSIFESNGSAELGVGSRDYVRFTDIDAALEQAIPFSLRGNNSKLPVISADILRGVSMNVTRDKYGNDAIFVSDEKLVIISGDLKRKIDDPVSVLLPGEIKALVRAFDLESCLKGIKLWYRGGPQDILLPIEQCHTVQSVLEGSIHTAKEGDILVVQKAIGEHYAEQRYKVDYYLHEAEEWQPICLSPLGKPPGHYRMEASEYYRLAADTHNRVESWSYQVKDLILAPLRDLALYSLSD